MKTKLITAAVAGFAMLFASCASRARVAMDGRPYLLQTCLVSGNDLDSLEDRQALVHNGQELKFCCVECVEKFRMNPAKYLAKLQ